VAKKQAHPNGEVVVTQAIYVVEAGLLRDGQIVQRFNQAQVACAPYDSPDELAKAAAAVRQQVEQLQAQVDSQEPDE